MTTVNFTNLTADVLKVTMPSGETIVASSAGVSVSTAPEVNNVVVQSPMAAPVAAPAAFNAPVASAPAPAAVVVAPEQAAPSAVLVGIQQ